MELIFHSPKNPHSHMTAKERNRESFPIRYLFQKGLINGRVLDFGCGLGSDVRFLRQKGYNVTGYDPHYAPDQPKGKFDTIVCIYVLNVLLPKEQEYVLMSISELLLPEGSAYFAVRRDIRRDGFRLHLKHRVEVYQCSVTLPYQSILRTDNCEIYHYRHYNQLSSPSTPSTCPFCTPANDYELLTESANAYAVLVRRPISPGHTLVIPKKHFTRYLQIPHYTVESYWSVVERVKQILNERFYPKHFNIKVDTDTVAGHVYIHIIPQYA
jgi:Diadenosine tetraphosphate (Ap4A) hydrolase and other HIT family hydrolases